MASSSPILSVERLDMRFGGIVALHDVSFSAEQGAVTAVIAGPRTLAQWIDYVAALDIAITPADEALVDSLVTPGHPSTPGYNDPVYPLDGR